MKKIVLIGTVSSSIFGFRKLLLKSLIKAGHEVYIFTTDLTPELQQHAKQELGINAEKYSLARTGMNPFSDISTAYYLSRQLKAISPDLVFSYFAKPLIWGTLAAKLAGVKKCYGMLEGLGYFFTDDSRNTSLKKKLIRSTQVILFHMSIPFLNGLVVLNPDDKKDLIDRYKIRVKNVMVLGGIGLDLYEYAQKPVPSGALSFIFIGRLLAEKGINEFLDAAENIHTRQPDVVFNVLGGLDTGNPGSVDPQRLTRLVEQGVIVYPGIVSNVSDWLSSTSIFVLPSYREGVPRSTQEAMAVGRPVITTDVPGCRETIRDGENGFIVPPHDFVKLAEAMERFIQNPELVAVMGQRSREMAEAKFDADEVNKRLLKFLEVRLE